MKKPQYRKFDYQPRYYKPEEDEGEKRKRRLGFRTTRKFKSRKFRNPIYWLVIFLIVFYLYLKLKGLI